MFPVIRECEYKERMYGEVLPYLDRIRVCGTYSRIPGQPLHFEHYDVPAEEGAPKGTVVHLHGYSEGLPKHYETVYYFLKNGYNVRQLQQRSHGKSYRPLHDPSKVHIPDYHDLIEDLNGYLLGRVLPESEGPYVLFGHSMGGAVAARYAECYPGVIPKLILSSPMMDLRSAKRLTRLLACLMPLAGKGEDFVPGHGPFTGRWNFAGSNASTECRFDYYLDVLKKNPVYRTWGSTWITTQNFIKLTDDVRKPEECARIKAEIVLFSAETDALVTLEGQEEFISRVPNGSLYICPNCRHEIYSANDETLTAYWKMITTFLAAP